MKVKKEAQRARLEEGIESEMGESVYGKIAE